MRFPKRCKFADPKCLKLQRGWGCLCGKGSQKEDERANDIARQTRARTDAEAAGIRQATALTPQETALRSQLDTTLGSRLGQTGEQLFGAQGPVSSTYAQQLLQRLLNPGMDWQSTVDQETQQALEEGLYPTLARRGISPTSPLAITEGRREARDVAINSAQRRLNQLNLDLSRGFDFGQFAGGLEAGARGEAGATTQNALARMAGGVTNAANLNAQGINQAASIESQQNQQNAQQRAAQEAFYRQLALAGISSVAGGLMTPGGLLGQGGSLLGWGAKAPQYTTATPMTNPAYALRFGGRY